MHMKTVLILLALALATVFALVCVLLTRGRAPGTCQHQPPAPEDTDGGQSLVFADLTREELAQVVRYLQGNLGAQLVDASHAKPSDNCIASVELQVPAKAEVLRFLDGGGPPPRREALAVLYFGNQPDPNVTEYVVGPLPTPAYHRDVTVQKYGGKVPYHRRPALAVEYKQLGGFLKSRVFPSAPSFMRQVMEYDGANLAAVTSAPRGFHSGDRVTWFILFQNVSGFFVHPVGLEDDLLEVVRIEKPQAEAVLGSMRPRHPPGSLGPLQYEPQGPRYRVRDNHVTFQGWSIAFGMNPNSGPRLFDIRYRGERIVYELSLQEALALYGSNRPGGMPTRYLDPSFGFEHDAALPLRRHFSDSQSLYYGGLRKNTLVIRAISTLINYDYIWDFMFHSSGAVEVRVHATGSISSSFLHGRGTDHGNRVGPHTLGTMHLHHIHYKVDLDVDGQLNSLETQDMEYELVKDPWSMQNTIERPYLHRERLETENEAAFPLKGPVPRYVSFASPNPNKWGHPRSYRIQVTSFAGEHLPTSNPMERSISWG
ncbi:PREDICTED: membrane primary amine oxidase-like, partial [Buceros rhinoceros silvestris]|uniref:membrane primary amine oxidase-like n=1 Tax=Buceros rhinoceros silvestris TaxID=175836 RepID=UPI0005292490